VTVDSTITMLSTWNVGHAVPVYTCLPLVASGASSGLPQEQRARGSPLLSINTAVPDCSTDWNAVACPFWNPWLVTRVSALSTTGVNVCR
jgi:hypothetical protein